MAVLYVILVLVVVLNIWSTHRIETRVNNTRAKKRIFKLFVWVFPILGSIQFLLVTKTQKEPNDKVKPIGPTEELAPSEITLPTGEIVPLYKNAKDHQSAIQYDFSATIEKLAQASSQAEYDRIYTVFFCLAVLYERCFWARLLLLMS